MAGSFGDFFLVSVSHETKHEKSSKNSGKFGAKFGAKFGTKILKIRGTFGLQLFSPNGSGQNSSRDRRGSSAIVVLTLLPSLSFLCLFFVSKEVTPPYKDLSDLAGPPLERRKTGHFSGREKEKLKNREKRKATKECLNHGGAKSEFFDCAVGPLSSHPICHAL